MLALFLTLDQKPLEAQDVFQMNLELVSTPEALTAGVPPDCSTWHEIYPAYCINHHQDGFEDNGDSLLSPCDIIVLDGVDWHVVWVGPTYWLNCDPTTPPAGYEPQDPWNGEDPTGQTWHEVYPNFCENGLVESWLDNGDGVVSVCDFVVIGGVTCHIDEIGLNIIVERDPTATEGSSWGGVKKKFSDLF